MLGNISFESEVVNSFPLAVITSIPSNGPGTGQRISGDVISVDVRVKSARDDFILPCPPAGFLIPIGRYPIGRNVDCLA